MNFNLSQIPERTQQPREHGITMVMDKGLSVEEAKKILLKIGLEYKIEGDNDKNITDQTPKPGVYLQKKSVVVIYTKKNEKELGN